MVNRLCLQAVNGEAVEHFSETIGQALGMKSVPGPVEDWDYEGEVVAHYRKNKLSRLKGNNSYTVTVVEGILLVKTRLHPVRDVIFTYGKGQEGLVLEAVRKLLSGSLQLILVPPDLEERVAMYTGRRSILPTGKERLDVLGEIYLPWQLYSINTGWQQLLLNPGDKVLIRQLRVKLRRFRSCFVFFKEALPKEFVLHWQKHLKSGADSLSKLRELDVALLTCERMRRQQIPGNSNPEDDRLAQLFANLREIETVSFFEGQCLNTHTLHTVEFIMSLRAELQRSGRGIKGKKFFNSRLARWIKNLKRLSDKYPDFSNMEDLHKIRIKVKRFRYVLQTIDLLKVDSSLVRRLKRLQDMLGFLHDDYVNAEWAQIVLARHPGDHSLNYRASEFLGWERAKAEAALQQVPELWESFLIELEAWEKSKKEN